MKQIAVGILVALAVLGMQGCTNPLTLKSNQAAPVEERSTPQLAGRQNVRPTVSTTSTASMVANRAEPVAVAKPRPTKDAPATVYARPSGGTGNETSEQLAPPKADNSASIASRSSQAESLQAGPVVSDQRRAEPVAARTREPVVAVAPAPQIVPDPPAFPAARRLVAQGDQLKRDGQLEEAAAAYERALEIAPADAWVWHRLAVVRSVQGQSGLARALARRSNALAAGDDKVLKANTPYL